MSPYAPIPFAIFFLCGILQFVFRSRVIRSLERYPEILDRIPGSLMLGMGLHRFIMRDDYKALGDAALDRRIRDYRRLLAVAFCAWLAYAGLLFAG